MRVDVKPELLAWARARSRSDATALSHRFPKLAEWEAGARSPTLKQLEAFAKATRTPVGYLFLEEPPRERVPIPDYRTMADADQAAAGPSPDLLDTIFLCQQRQEWYRDFAQVTGEAPLAFIGSASRGTPIVETAAELRGALNFDVSQRGSTWTQALRRLIDNAEHLGVLVMVSGVVGSNTHRKLDPREFRGFALADPLSPLVFVNGADTKAAQIFTLAHELAHLWLGETALSDVDMAVSSGSEVERWCNEVAAEFLVPLASIRAHASDDTPTPRSLERLARLFKVSTLVVLRRLRDANFVPAHDYARAYGDELGRILALVDARPSGDGGNFLNTQPLRVSQRFARAVIASTLEGNTLYRDAFQLLGFKKLSTFETLADRLGPA